MESVYEATTQEDVYRLMSNQRRRIRRKAARLGIEVMLLHPWGMLLVRDDKVVMRERDDYDQVEKWLNGEVPHDHSTLTLDEKLSEGGSPIYRYPDGCPS